MTYSEIYDKVEKAKNNSDARSVAALITFDNAVTVDIELNDTPTYPTVQRDESNVEELVSDYKDLLVDIEGDITSSVEDLLRHFKIANVLLVVIGVEYERAVDMWINAIDDGGFSYANDNHARVSAKSKVDSFVGDLESEKFTEIQSTPS